MIKRGPPRAVLLPLENKILQPKNFHVNISDHSLSGAGAANASTKEVAGCFPGALRLRLFLSSHPRDSCCDVGSPLLLLLSPLLFASPARWATPWSLWCQKPWLPAPCRTLSLPKRNPHALPLLCLNPAYASVSWVLDSRVVVNFFSF